MKSVCLIAEEFVALKAELGPPVRSWKRNEKHGRLMDYSLQQYTSSGDPELLCVAQDICKEALKIAFQQTGRDEGKEGEPPNLEELPSSETETDLRLSEDPDAYGTSSDSVRHNETVGLPLEAVRSFAVKVQFGQTKSFDGHGKLCTHPPTHHSVEMGNEKDSQDEAHADQHVFKRFEPIDELTKAFTIIPLGKISFSALQVRGTEDFDCIKITIIVNLKPMDAPNFKPASSESIDEPSFIPPRQLAPEERKPKPLRESRSIEEPQTNERPTRGRLLHRSSSSRSHTVNRVATPPAHHRTTPDTSLPPDMPPANKFPFLVFVDELEQRQRRRGNSQGRFARYLPFTLRWVKVPSMRRGAMR